MPPLNKHYLDASHEGSELSSLLSSPTESLWPENEQRQQQRPPPSSSSQRQLWKGPPSSTSSLSPAPPIMHVSPSLAPLLAPMPSPVAAQAPATAAEPSAGPSAEPSQKVNAGSGARSKKRGRLSNRPQPPFICFCGKQFKRHEHMSRHQATHSDHIKYECPICGKAFRRQDVMHRHTQTHLRTSTGVAQQRTRAQTARSKSNRQAAALSRAGRACVPCKRAKLRCDGSLPCSRCAGHPSRNCCYQLGNGAGSPSTSTPVSSLEASPAGYSHVPVLTPLPYSNYHAYENPSGGYERYSLVGQQSPTSMSVHGFSAGQLPPILGQGHPHPHPHSAAAHPRSYPTEIEAGFRSAASYRLEPPVQERYYVPTQSPMGIGANHGSIGLALHPASMAWSSSEPASHDGFAARYSQPAIYNSARTHADTAPIPRRFEFQLDHPGLHSASLSEASLFSDAGTPVQPNTSYDASTFASAGGGGVSSHSNGNSNGNGSGNSNSNVNGNVNGNGSDALAPPPPPPAYIMFGQGLVKEEAGYHSLPSSTDTAFYHFNSTLEPPISVAAGYSM